MPRIHESAEQLVDDLLLAVGKNIVLGLPIGLGKSILVANALFERALRDPSLSLSIFTGLILARPHAGGDLEARLLEPIAERLYGGWPRQAYAEAMERGELPDNIRIREFYLRPGAFLDNELVQRNYTSINYSQVVNELLELGVNVIGQLVTTDDDQPGRYSLSCNPEVTLDLLPNFRAARAAGRPVAVVGEVNRHLPYMPGAAEVEAADFDFLLDNASTQYPLFGLPNRRVSPADFATGMHAASLVADGGTLQLGIGSLSDAVAHCLRLRHEHPDIFSRVLERLPGGSSSERRRQLPLECAPFNEGLYACTEFMSDGILALLGDGIIKRAADADDDTLVHAGFFIGSNHLYDTLNAMSESQRRRIAMSRISFVNTLHGDSERKRRQRRKGRFINETMMATLLGTAVSDGLEGGRVVSGVGGQFDFVNMAGELADAHSILMLRASRRSRGDLKSNLRWTYGHTTIPRQHRDLFVTEYGVAATRGRTDQQVIDAMLHIADARFQQALADEARSARKIAAAYRLDAEAAANTPENIAAVFSEPGLREYFPDYPLGTDLTPEEQHLAVALPWLAQATTGTLHKCATVVRALLASEQPRHAAALARMGLDAPDGVGERVLGKLVGYALTESIDNEDPH